MYSSNLIARDMPTRSTSPTLFPVATIDRSLSRFKHDGYGSLLLLRESPLRHLLSCEKRGTAETCPDHVPKGFAARQDRHSFLGLRHQVVGPGQLCHAPLPSGLKARSYSVGREARRGVSFAKLPYARGEGPGREGEAQHGRQEGAILLRGMRLQGVTMRASSKGRALALTFAFVGSFLLGPACGTSDEGPAVDPDDYSVAEKLGVVHGDIGTAGEFQRIIDCIMSSGIEGAETEERVGDVLVASWEESGKRDSLLEWARVFC